MPWIVNWCVELPRYLVVECLRLGIGGTVLPRLGLRVLLDLWFRLLDCWCHRMDSQVPPVLAYWCCRHLRLPRVLPPSFLMDLWLMLSRKTPGGTGPRVE